MSNLDFTISLLVYVLSKLSQFQPASFKVVKERFDKLNGMNRAINILEEEKRKDEMEERGTREKALRGL